MPAGPGREVEEPHRDAGDAAADFDDVRVHRGVRPEQGRLEIVDGSLDRIGFALVFGEVPDALEHPGQITGFGAAQDRALGKDDVLAHRGRVYSR
nr:hypothetical protein [Glycomyces xiaoerkulensis]